MTREFEVIKNQFVEALAIYSLVIMLGGLFISSIIQGVVTHLAGNVAQGTMLYFGALASLVAAVFVYKRGRKILEAAT